MPTPECQRDRGRSCDRCRGLSRDRIAAAIIVHRTHGRRHHLDRRCGRLDRTTRLRPNILIHVDEDVDGTGGHPISQRDIAVHQSASSPSGDQDVASRTAPPAWSFDRRTVVVGVGKELGSARCPSAAPHVTGRAATCSAASVVLSPVSVVPSGRASRVARVRVCGRSATAPAAPGQNSASRDVVAHAPRSIAKVSSASTAPQDRLTPQ